MGISLDPLRVLARPGSTSMTDLGSNRVSDGIIILSPGAKNSLSKSLVYLDQICFVLKPIMRSFGQKVCSRRLILWGESLTLQGHSERTSKVKSLWKSQCSQNLSFLSCFRPEISGKFIPHRIQVHHNHPEASSEAGGSNGLSGTGRLLEADHWLWDSEKRPKMIVSVCEGQNRQFEWILICSCC